RNIRTVWTHQILAVGDGVEYLAIGLLRNPARWFCIMKVADNRHSEFGGDPFAVACGAMARRAVNIESLLAAREQCRCHRHRIYLYPISRARNFASGDGRFFVS